MLRTPRIPLLGALASLAGLALTGVLAFLLPLARERDSATLQGFTALNRPRLTPVFDRVAHLADPASYALIGLVLAGIALGRGRPRIAVTVVGLLAVTGWTTETLKPLLASPRHDEWLGSGQIAAASWPSGHATAAMTLALCGILVAPARWRPTAAAVGVVFAIGVSYAILALGWHFPSDVLGGFFVAMTWTLAAVAGLVALERRWPSAQHAAAPVARRAVEGVAPVALLLGAAMAFAAAWIARPDAAGSFAADHTTFMAGAASIAALAVALVLGLARGVRSTA